MSPKSANNTLISSSLSIAQSISTSSSYPGGNSGPSGIYRGSVYNCFFPFKMSARLCSYVGSSGIDTSCVSCWNWTHHQISLSTHDLEFHL